jgi:predicted nuclease of predicted toxin-antitoxin system
MRNLIDESLPRYIKRMLSGHMALTVQEMGWTGAKNGKLLSLAESQFDVFLTADKNLRYQQNLIGKRLAVIVFPSNRLSIVKTLQDRLDSALSGAKPGQVIELGA